MPVTPRRRLRGDGRPPPRVRRPDVRHPPPHRQLPPAASRDDGDRRLPRVSHPRLDSRRRRCTLTAGHHRIISGLLTDIAEVGEVLAAATRMICDPAVTFNRSVKERWGYGERKHARSYLGRDNLYEALEEVSPTRTSS